VYQRLCNTIRIGCKVGNNVMLCQVYLLKCNNLHVFQVSGAMANKYTDGKIYKMVNSIDNESYIFNIGSTCNHWISAK